MNEVRRLPQKLRENIKARIERENKFLPLQLPLLFRIFLFLLLLLLGVVFSEKSGARARPPRRTGESSFLFQKEDEEKSSIRRKSTGEFKVVPSK